MNDELPNAIEAGESVARRGWLSGGVAQVTVLVTGTILAITAHTILGLLIAQLSVGSHERISRDIRQHIEKEITGLQLSLSLGALVAAHTGELPADEVRFLVRSAFPLDTAFENIYWAKPRSGGAWEIFTIAARSDKGFEVTAIKGLLQAVIAEDTIDAASILADAPGTVYWHESTDPIVSHRPFAVARSVMKGSADMGLMIGIASFSRMIDPLWLKDTMSISGLAIRNVSTAQPLYTYTATQKKGDAASDRRVAIYAETLNAGNNKWQLQVHPGTDRATQFLARTPWLMLVFGMVLTVLGTLYVRSNQKQTLQQGAMNRELARKNYELNAEIAERERLNQAVRKAEREYRAIIDAVSDIIFETTTGGEIVFLNDTWEKITGFEAEQVRGRVLFDLLHPQDQEEQRSSFNMLVKGKKGAYRSLTRVRTSSGAFRTMELAVSMLRQDENRNMRVVGTLTDIEERRRAEKALSEAEKKYRTIVENAAGGIYQVTPEGQFLSVNPAMARVLGYDGPEQVLREVRNAHDHLYLSVRDRANFIRELETAGSVHSFETQVKRRDGRKIWVSENARAVRDDDGNILYYEGSMEDITARKQSDISLREAKIQSDLANRAKSEFLANMSHELRTPLNAIIGFSEIISNQALGPLQNAKYQDYARMIHESGARLLTIINEILDVSRIEVGERQINESVVDVDGVIRFCLEFMGQKITDAGLTVSNLAGGKVPKLIGEELALKQIMLNLVGNAIKFTPQEGRITLSHEIEVNGRLRISVTDTGVGMEDHEIQKALSPFGRVDASHSRMSSGAGLGLTLVESLMKLHQGDVEIFSQKGIGTTVSIVFPASRVAVESIVTAAGDGASGDAGQGGEDSVAAGESRGPQIH